MMSGNNNQETQLSSRSDQCVCVSCISSVECGCVGVGGGGGGVCCMYLFPFLLLSSCLPDMVRIFLFLFLFFFLGLSGLLLLCFYLFIKLMVVD